MRGLQGGAFVVERGPPGVLLQPPPVEDHPKQVRPTHIHARRQRGRPLTMAIAKKSLPRQKYNASAMIGTNDKGGHAGDQQK